MSGWVPKKSMESILGIYGNHEKENTGTASGEFRYRSAKEATIEEGQRIRGVVEEIERARVALGELAANGSSSNYTVLRDNYGNDAGETLDEAEIYEEIRDEECEGRAHEQPEDEMSADAISKLAFPP